MATFFVDQEIKAGQTLHIVGEDAHHILRVLRLGLKDTIKISDGDNFQGLAIIEEVNFRQQLIKVRVLVKNRIIPIKPQITLIQGMPKGNKMDFILQKNTELGVSRFYPITTERTVVDLSQERITRRKRRWEKIVREASKQCQRADIPEVMSPISLDDIPEIARDYDLCLVPWEEEKARGLGDVLRGSQVSLSSVLMLIGPEGGLTRREIQKLTDMGFVRVGLGPRILRTETAGMALSSVLMYELGELGGKRL